MVKNFSSSDLSTPNVFSTLVRAASKLSLDELARVTGGSTEDADTIITVSLGRMLSRRWRFVCMRVCMSCVVRVRSILGFYTSGCRSTESPQMHHVDRPNLRRCIMHEPPRF